MFAFSELDRKDDDLKSCSAREISMTLNALSKRHVQNDALFEVAGERATSMIGTFTSQGLANTVNAYAKMRYRSPALFEAVSDAAIPVLHTLNSQTLANTVAAFAKQRHDCTTTLCLFQDTANTVKARSSLGEWHLEALSAVVYAFMKAGKSDQELLDVVGGKKCFFERKLCSMHKHVGTVFCFLFLCRF